MDGADKKDKKDAVDRDKVKEEREARRLAKVAAKQKNQDQNRDLANVSPPSEVKVNPMSVAPAPKKQQKQNAAAESKKPEASPAEAVTGKLEQLNISDKKNAKNAKDAENVKVGEDTTKKVLSKAERRAIQEAQRAAKAAKVTAPGGVKPALKVQPKIVDSNVIPAKKGSVVKEISRKSPSKASVGGHRVKLFNHLYTDESASPTNIVNSSAVPAPIIRLGVQYATGIVKGCNARCIAFLNAIKLVIKDYRTPAEKEFGRSLETSLKVYVDYLHSCRPIAVSVQNAVKYLRWQISQLPPGGTEEEVTPSTAKHISNILQ